MTMDDTHNCPGRHLAPDPVPRRQGVGAMTSSLRAQPRRGPPRLARVSTFPWMGSLPGGMPRTSIRGHEVEALAADPRRARRHGEPVEVGAEHLDRRPGCTPHAGTPAATTY